MHPKTLAPVKSNFTKINSRTWPAAIFALAISSFALAVETSNQANTVSGGELAIAQMEVTPGLKVSLFADESLISHPVAFCADEKGRFFVAESFRFMEPNGAWSDIRPRMDWLDEDLACRNLEDRQKLYLSRLGPKISEWKQLSERIRLIEDRDRDGKADHASVFAEGFNDILDGTAAGIMARKGTVWFTCIPSLWQLREGAGSEKADLKKSLHRGFGVRLGYLGHDLHGLCIGPDGKLYFSIGDRGTYIEKDVARVVDLPDTGAVFRCNQNGSNLEVFATGLRNPQELAFDKFGNLWTCDNNADHGDKARWVYVVEGGDSGWRVGFQHVTYPIVLGPWNSEKLWHPSWKGQSAAIVPPIANFAQGPSGVAYYPGTGMGAEFEDKFLVCDFLGDNGGIHSLSVQPKGASFELTGSSHFVWRIPATDVEFGPDGSVYACTWNGNVDAHSLAYIYKISNPLSDVDTQVAETQRLLAEGMSRRSDMELAKWLDHKDMRIRREAQFGLVERGLAAVTTLEKVLPRPETLPRLHALWGLGQIATKFPKQRTRILKSVIAALEYPDLEVQTQAAKVLGDTGHQEAFDPLADLLSGTSAPRVRFFAAQSLGKLGNKKAVEPLVALLRKNSEDDAFLRHAAVYAWASLNDPEGVKRFVNDPSASVRLGATLVMRRLRQPEIAEFLNDADPMVVVEAARAIHDEPINPAMPQLAALAINKDIPTNENTAEALWRRVVNANYRIGGSANAEALAGMAARADLPPGVREEALQDLGGWSKPSNRDAVLGLWRPLKERDPAFAREAARKALPILFSNETPGIRIAALNLAGKYELKETAAALRAITMDTAMDGATRVEALKALAIFKEPSLLELTGVLCRDEDADLRKEAENIEARLLPGQGAERWLRSLQGGTINERQNALARLALSADPSADATIKDWMERLLAGKVPPELELDVLEAAGKREPLNYLVRQFEESLSKGNPPAPYRMALAGGNAVAGKKIYMERAEVSCVRCHKIGAEGGEVGPNLAGVGKQKREYLLQAIVAPNEKIAAGFEMVILKMKDGKIHAGTLKKETSDIIEIISPTDGSLNIRKSDIAERQRGPSGMPEGFGSILSKRELRDLIEFLATLK